MTAPDKRPARKQSLAELLATVPEPSEDEVTAAVYAHRSGVLDGLQPDFDHLAPWMKASILGDMRLALHAAAMVRVVAATGASA